ncbi:NAD(P)-binding protein [Aspergillus ellipticus CBS 707.79]|uniref:NAD(P)-binding protein n=1 Tax=Aspergillus ellipticus CBS 707.79 TaxID=1448320 RepID=A0A319DGA2_9EURO|nr:NAD(P)-binding protein [Aspergillus ellipticus CBS 707.79]
MTTTVLITGANKGIGRGLVQKYLARPETTVIAAVRSPKSTDSKSLADLPTDNTSRLITIKIDASSNTDAHDAVKTLEKHDIASLDIVIANAGVVDATAFVPVAEVKITQLQDYLDVNTVGPVRLFQATLPLLRKSSRARFILMSSLLATISDAKDIPFPIGAYGASKAAANFLVQKIDFENEGIATLAVNPGSVKTASGNEAARAVGFPEAAVELHESVDAIVAKIDMLSKGNGSAQFWGIDGTIAPW